MEIGLSTDYKRFVTCDAIYEYYELLTTGDLKGLFDVEKIFLKYQELYTIILSHRENPIIALEAVKVRLTEFDEDECFLIYRILAAKLNSDLQGIFIFANDKLKLCLSLVNKEVEVYCPCPTEEAEEGPAFDWRATKVHLNSLSDDHERLAHLIDIIALYQQEVIANDLPSSGFDIKCKSEMERIKQQQELKKMQNAYGGNLLLSSTKGVRIDFIRIINAMYEMRFFQDTNGQIPSKETVMTSIGGTLGVNLAKYDVDLSQALNNGSAESNVAIFEAMSKTTTKAVTNRICK
ncbi:hypothetical protein [Chitinophaga defluvii]|uniref:Uncharacterized protein n=1 Tax=Chitinophaga defluvii TaxID=3163343 RepID=A0ABV2T8T8_9BACT